MTTPLLSGSGRSVDGYVFDDADCDGARDAADTGFGGVRVEITSIGDAAPSLSASTVTSDDGSFVFEGIEEGAYRVTIDASTIPSAAVPCLAMSGDPGTFLSRTAVVAEPGDEDSSTVLFGFSLEDTGSPGCSGAVEGLVWLDANCDGIFDPEESDLGRLTVLLRGAEDEILAVTTPSHEAGEGGPPIGFYRFDNLCAGYYRVEVISSADSTGEGPSDCPGWSRSVASRDVVLTEDSSSESAVDVGACVEAAVVIGDRVWVDRDDDEQFDLGEGLNGIALRLLDENGGLVSSTVTTTDRFGHDGHYLFEDVPLGLYSVEVDATTLPPGLNRLACDLEESRCSPAVVAVSDACSRNLSIDFGFEEDDANDPDPRLIGSIGDTVWVDPACAGKTDQNSGGIAGLRVFLESPEGDILDETTTDSGGRYSFDNLALRTYIVAIGELPSCLEVADFSALPETDDSIDASDPSRLVVTLTDEAATNHFADFRLCSGGAAAISGLVWNDLSGDGIQQPSEEPGVPGVRVDLFSAAGDFLCYDETDSTGRYEFAGLCPGDYFVEVDAQTLSPCFSPTLCEIGEDRSLDSSCGRVLVSLESVNSRDETVDFGFRSRGRGRIGDLVWFDEDGDGLQSDVERAFLGLMGVRVTLFAEDGQILAEQETGPTGRYRFDGLCAGTYRVTVEVPNTKTLTLCDVGDDDARDSECLSALVVLLTDESVDNTVDFGIRPECGFQLGDRVWEDADCDGLQDVGEGGLAGVEVVLRNADTDLVLARVETDENGLFFFRGLCAGPYRLSVSATTVPSGLAPTPCDQGSDDTVDSDCDAVARFPLDSAELESTFDFGFCPQLGQGASGCSPGYWGRPQHLSAWPAPYLPETRFSSVFDDAFGEQTLLDVLNSPGGALAALGRQTVAALLSARRDPESFGITQDEVIERFNETFPGDRNTYEVVKDRFEMHNLSSCEKRLEADSE